jgi:hypothetical protein
VPNASRSTTTEAPDHSEGEASLHGSSGEEEDAMFQERLEKAETAFTEHRIGESSLLHLSGGVLQAMCRARGLEAEGKKRVLAQSLICWVRYHCKGSPPCSR